MNKSGFDVKLSLIPLLLMVLGAVLYFQYGGEDSGATEIAELADRKNLPGYNSAGSGTALLEVPLNALEVEELQHFDPFARRGAIAALYPAPEPPVKSVQRDEASLLVGLKSSKTILPPNSLVALLKTDDGWTAIVGSQLVKIGDLLVSGDNGPYAVVTNIDEQGVLLQAIDSPRAL